MTPPDSLDKSNKHLTDTAGIYSILTAFKKYQQSIKISPETSKQQYSTVILRCEIDSDEYENSIFVTGNFESGEPVAEQLTPKIGKTYTIEGVVDNTHYVGTACICLETSGSLENIRHCFSFPKTINSQQRRQTFRTTVPRSLNNHIEINYENSSAPILGRIIDMSVTGIACECPVENTNLESNIQSSLKNRDLTLSIHIENIVDIQCCGKLKIIKSRAGSEYQRFGLEFIGLNTRNERLINKAVVDLQRLTRKTQAR